MSGTNSIDDDEEVPTFMLEGIPVINANEELKVPKTRVLGTDPYSHLKQEHVKGYIHGDRSVSTGAMSGHISGPVDIANRSASSNDTPAYRMVQSTMTTSPNINTVPQSASIESASENEPQVWKGNRDRMTLNANIYKPVAHGNQATHGASPKSGHSSPMNITPQYLKYPIHHGENNSQISSQIRRNHGDHQRQASDPSSTSASEKTTLMPSMAAISWKTNDPAEWTLDRVLYWLELNKFGPDWIEAFKSRNICGEAFLSLSNYQNLKKFGHFTVKTEDYDASFSKFLHLIRKLLQRSASNTSLEREKLPVNTINGDSTRFIPPSAISDHEASDILTPDSSGSQSLEQIKSDFSAMDLVNGDATKNLSTSVSSSGSVKSPNNELSSELQVPARQENISAHERPFSTFENNSKSLWQIPSPQSPSVRTHRLFKRHHKSNSSESSILNNGSANILQTSSLDDKYPHSDNSRDEEPKKSHGFLDKLRRRDNKTRSREDLLKIDSPTSPSATTAATAATSTTEFLQLVMDASKREYSGSSVEAAAMSKSEPEDIGTKRRSSIDVLSHSLASKYLPSKQSTAQKLILATLNNEHFTVINIENCDNIDQVKRKIATELGLMTWIGCTVHLTDFGSTRGEALDDNIVSSILFNDLSIKLDGPIKLLISTPPQQEFTKSPGQMSISSDPSIKQYPPTPSHMINAGRPDTFNSQDYFSVRPVESSNLPSIVVGSDKSVMPRKSDASTYSTSSTATTRMLRVPSSSYSPTSDDNFKVIRPDRREINFDDRRQSPYDRKPNVLVAKRTAPPAPMSRQESIKRLQLKDLSLAGQLHTHTKPTKMNITLNTTNLPAANQVKTFSPGQSELLIPRPYVGRQNMVTRKPVKKDSPSTETQLGKPKFKLPEYGSKEDADSKKTNQQIHMFHENEITFDDAPAFADSGGDGSDEDNDGDGLWAKKPPKTIPSPVNNSTFLEKPTLRVQTVHRSSPSPISPHRSPGASSANESPTNLPEDEDMWARPPAEVVYENIEQFFPNADLDKPIIDDPHSPPVSPKSESSQNTRETFKPALSPVVEPKESTAKDFFNGNGTNSSTDSLEDKPLIRVKGSSGIRTRSQAKSLRVVVREASEARKRSSMMDNSGGKSGALLRRKSTKFWGQELVEMKPNEIDDGHMSTLRDQNGNYRKFVWVKGELIGKGTFGNVYLALNVTLREMMAVKQVEVPRTALDMANAKQQEVVEAIHSEVETLKDLDHLNIVQYLGFEALPDVYNLFLEYVPGGSVSKILQMYGRFEEPLIRSLTKQVLEGLSYLHSCGILHRDLKADNLLLDLDGICKISDFGISKKSGDIYANNAEMSMQGTIFWMAPEVIHNVVHNEKQGYSAKVDVWSLGCVVLEMFAGRRPWSTDEAIGAMYKLGTSRQAPPIPEDTVPFVSAIGKDFIDQCFTIDPDKRPTPQRLLNHVFCLHDADYDFKRTKLGKMIQLNSKQKERLKRRIKQSRKKVAE